MTHLESVLGAIKAVLAAEKAQADERDAKVVSLKAENNNLRQENDNLRLELQRLQSRECGHLEILQEMRDMRAGIGELQAAPREQRRHSTPMTPRCASTLESSTLQMSPLVLSSTFNNSIQNAGQHRDVTLHHVSPEDHARIHQQSHGQVGRYGCLLFRTIIPEEYYRAWSKTTNWYGSKGKRALPQDVKNFVISTLQQKFPDIGSSGLMDCIDKINEFLRKTGAEPKISDL